MDTIWHRLCQENAKRAGRAGGVGRSGDTLSLAASKQRYPLLDCFQSSRYISFHLSLSVRFRKSALIISHNRAIAPLFRRNSWLFFGFECGIRVLHYDKASKIKADGFWTRREATSIGVVLGIAIAGWLGWVQIFF